MIILLSAADILQVCAEAGTIRKGETPLAGRKYGLDLGTMNIRIFQGGHGLVVYEKNMIAIQRKKEVAAIGNDAFEMYERTPASIVISNPVRDGVIADINNMNKVAEALLKKCGCTSGFMRNNSFYLVKLPVFSWIKSTLTLFCGGSKGFFVFNVHFTQV